MVERFSYSEHARNVMKEREIPDDWVELTVNEPERKESKEDGTVHFIRAVAEREGRHLRVVVNTETDPPAVVTVFFDRRLGRKI